MIYSACHRAGTLGLNTLMLLAMGGTTFAQGSTRFSEFVRLPHPVDKVTTMAFCIGDLDGDGDADVLVGKGAVGRPSILIGDGRGGFKDESVQRIPLDAGAIAYAVALGDVDADGDLDAFVGQLGRFSNAPDRLLINDGKGYFKDLGATHLPKGGWGSQLATESAHFVDLDGDGDLDLCFVNDSGGLGPLPIYWNDGKGRFSFAWGHVPTLPHLGYGLAVGDIDGDKDIDLVYGTMFNGIRVLVNDGQRKFLDQTAARIPRTGSQEALPVLGDVDGDGDLDLIVGTLWGYKGTKLGQTVLYLNDGKGVFKEVTATQMPIDDDYTTNLYLRDFDLDGDQDLLIVNQTVKAPGTKFYANDGKGFFTDRTAIFLPQTTQFPGGTLSDCVAIGIGDLDGDGDLDLIAGKMGLPSPNGPINDVLVWNTTRHLYAPSSSAATYALDVWGEPGQLALLFVALKPRRLALPGLGVLELDLGQTLQWPGVQVLPQSRQSRWNLALPNWMKGRKLYSQAFLYDSKQPARSRLTNAFEDLIQ